MGRREAQVILGKVLRPDLFDFLERRVHGFGFGLCDVPGVYTFFGQILSKTSYKFIWVVDMNT